MCSRLFLLQKNRQRQREGSGVVKKHLTDVLLLIIIFLNVTEIFHSVKYLKKVIQKSVSQK